MLRTFDEARVWDFAVPMPLPLAVAQSKERAQSVCLNEPGKSDVERAGSIHYLDGSLQIALFSSIGAPLGPFREIKR